MLTDAEWKAINEIVLLVNGTDDLHSMRVYFLKAVKALIPYDKACFYLFQQSEKAQFTITDPVTVNLDTQAVTDYINILNTDIIGCRVINLHKTIAYNSTELLPKVNCNSIPFLRNNHVAYYCGIVLANNQNPIGETVLYRISSSGDFTPHEIEYLEILKEHLLLRAKNLYLASIREDRDIELEALPLTKREKEVVLLLMKQCSIKEISAQLVVCENTTKKHIQHIFQKLEIKNRHQLFNKIKNLNYLMNQ